MFGTRFGSRLEWFKLVQSGAQGFEAYGTTCSGMQWKDLKCGKAF